MAEPLGTYRLTSHALRGIQRRGIQMAEVRQVLSSPQQRYTVRPGRDVLQRKTAQSGKVYLLRVFVDVDRHPAEVVTAYKTSKIAKYRRSES